LQVNFEFLKVKPIYRLDVYTTLSSKIKIYCDVPEKTVSDVTYHQVDITFMYQEISRNCAIQYFWCHHKPI